MLLCIKANKTGGDNMEYKQLFKGDYKPLFGTVSHDWDAEITQ